MPTSDLRTLGHDRLRDCFHKRTKSYARRAFETIIEDAPGIWLYQPPTIAGLHKRIRTTTLRPDGYWSHIADWYIPAGERTSRDQIGLRPAQ